MLWLLVAKIDPNDGLVAFSCRFLGYVSKIGLMCSLMDGLQDSLAYDGFFMLFLGDVARWFDW